MKKLVSLENASEYASKLTKKNITPSNINYLIQYGRIDKVETPEGTAVYLAQLKRYYEQYKKDRNRSWKHKLGRDLNWALSFENYTETQTTKHVHRLHPYKGKYIPQLVQYFLDDHIDHFKKEIFFRPGDIVLDPFCGSGTTLVQANELSIHAIGIDISTLNTQISNCKINSYNIDKLQSYIEKITRNLEIFERNNNIAAFENRLLEELYKFNNAFFPSPEYKKKIYSKQLDEKSYANKKAAEFEPIFYRLAKEFNIAFPVSNNSFLEKWFFPNTREEISLLNKLIKETPDNTIKDLLQVILSRTIRSSRTTPHSDLATLTEPVYTTYYCTKHKKLCKPIFSILKWWKIYSKDTVKRLQEFSTLRTSTIQHCFTGDSTQFDLERHIKNFNETLYKIYKKNKIRGIFCSPPYIGLIDYHEQHAYAYEVFSLPRNDSLEIGSLAKGHSKAAIRQYVHDIAAVLINCKKYLAADYDIFIVANDKYNVYPQVADLANMIIIEEFERPVLNRTEKDKSAYSEKIFRLKEKIT